jgi:hypothetical protein
LWRWWNRKGGQRESRMNVLVWDRLGKDQCMGLVRGSEGSSWRERSCWWEGSQFQHHMHRRTAVVDMDMNREV